MVLAEDATKVAPREKDRSTSMESLDTRLFSAMRRNHVNLGRLRANQTHARRFIAVHPALARAQVAFAEMRVGARSLLGRID